MNKLKELWVKLKGIKNFEIILALVIIAIVVIIYSIVSSVGAKEVTEERKGWRKFFPRSTARAK